MSYDDWNEDGWGDEEVSRPSAPTSASDDKAELAAIRRELAGLKSLFGRYVDNAEEVQMDDHRRALRERAERDAKAEAAANDPETLEKLRRIDSPEELERFLREHGTTDL